MYNQFPYRKYSSYLVDKYGERVYKIPVNLPVTCPNRTGEGHTGCTYCGDYGAGFETLPSSFSVSSQLRQNMDFIGKKYKTQKFIAYFQNFTNTFMPPKEFQHYMEAAAQEDIVEIAIATRPDCIHPVFLDILQRIKEQYKVEISLEMGLQTVNYKTLSKVNRGHSLAEFIDAVLQIRPYNFDICTHMILNLPWDDREDVIEGAKVLSALGIRQIKLHALYLVKGTVLLEQVQSGEVEVVSLEEYKERVKLFLQYLAPDIAIQRIIGRAPRGFTKFANWSTSWWKIRDDIEAEMQAEGMYQGQKCDYLGGKFVKGFCSTVKKHSD